MLYRKDHRNIIGTTEISKLLYTDKKAIPLYDNAEPNSLTC